MDAPGLYFIALVIEGETGERITELKEFMASNYKSRRALNSPPHITLIPPFKMTNKRIDSLMSRLQRISNGFQPISINLDGFDAFKPRVIFIHPDENPKLKDLRNDLLSDLTENFDEIHFENRGFNPHVTIAFRDLTVENFHAAWQEFESREFLASYICRSVSLLKHNGRKWEVFRKVPLGQSDT